MAKKKIMAKKKSAVRPPPGLYVGKGLLVVRFKYKNPRKRVITTRQLARLFNVPELAGE